MAEMKFKLTLTTTLSTGTLPQIQRCIDAMRFPKKLKAKDLLDKGATEMRETIRPGMDAITLVTVESLDK